MQTIPRTCQCETVPDPGPDLPGRRITNPLCPAHPLPGPAEDPTPILDLYNLAWSYRQGEWVHADGIDMKTGEPYTEDSAA